MTTINTSSPLASYLASAGKVTTATTASSQEKPAESSKDPIAELRSLARQMVARSEGGLLRALNGGGSLQPSISQSLSGSKAGESGAKIELPDVAAMDRDDAAKLLAQINKLVESGMDKTGTFVGYNGDKQTDSLATYRDWLQARGGVSIYV